MDRRSWPWKKKSSDKTIEKIISSSDSAGASLVSAGSPGNQENSKKVKYVQLSVESYTHFTGLEEQVKALEEEVKLLEDEVKVSEDKLKTLNEDLTSAQSEMITKDNLVKQHAKVAEEAVSGWEKAEAEASALKHQLESVTLLKLTAEDRASHLDGALKECMRQIRNLKEEHELKLHEVVLTKTKQWDKIKHDFEAKIGDLKQELLRSSGENAALSRSLQERSNMLMKVSEEKSQAEAEIELLKTNIQSCEKEINSFKYELHIVSKELEIRNEEKNMSMRSAEVATKQNLEGVKKIAKLEAECQRLRGLVRKKLPGPAALAQMKHEVENLGRDYGEIRPRRSPVRSPSPHLAPLPEFSLDNVQQFHKETEFLTARLLAMEEETNMLKEALAKRNSELQTSRNMCAKTASMLRSLEAQMQALNLQKSSPKSTTDMPIEGSSSQSASNPPSLTSMSEDGIDEDGSVVESWATALISELSQFKKERDAEKVIKADNPKHLELMDDFLEMERMACLSAEPNGAISTSAGLTNKVTENGDHSALADVTKGEQQTSLDPSVNQVSSNVELESDTDQVPLLKLRSRISMVFESQAKDANVEKVLEDIKHVVLNLQDSLLQNSVSSTVEENKNCEDNVHTIDQELAAAISQIHDFVVSLGKEAMAMQDRYPDGHGLNKKVEEFSASVSKILCSKMSLVDFVFDLSHVLAKAGELSFNVLGYKGNEGETSMSDCIDKVALPENKVVQDDLASEKFPNGGAHISHSTSDPEVLQDGSPIPGFELNSKSCKCSLEELEQLKSDKHNMEMDLTRCTEELESTKSQLQETEQLMEELRTQLASSQKSNSLADTQLKCMAESYKSLEMRSQELEAEVNLLRTKTEALDDELQEEKRSHQNALDKCNDLQEQIKRSESCSKCLSSSAADVVDTEIKQEREIAAAAEKLAECQETIFLLSRQLKSLRPPTELMGSPQNEMHQKGGSSIVDEPTPSGLNPESIPTSKDFDQAEMETAASNFTGVGGESPSDAFNSSSYPSDTEANMLLRSPVNSTHPRHRPTRSGSCTTSLAATPEKHSRGFSRFFSSKTKNGH
ncbi:filament-like plant protein 4 [Telopea speciosissima]|uniref:filament-like plant protein 4 n=1 Tax=Telopea speciosissima TaxID=54955 RepID=UPI001CC653E6|nr:filament-like plant protein 4 [Telopea speciosissima]XP_043712664.1 filament-like plant protein 4 [Telopea speciosissima]XP_043712665.1 filament-like plant protein 4 [Telopea speciosissima]